MHVIHITQWMIALHKFFICDNSTYIVCRTSIQCLSCKCILRRNSLSSYFIVLTSIAILLNFAPLSHLIYLTNIHYKHKNILCQLLKYIFLHIIWKNYKRIILNDRAKAWVNKLLKSILYTYIFHMLIYISN